ncbi:MAG: serine/threonine-protein kinase, partial [Polyangia bacterium]|nr:serine/threonine-protein kinase [Polyangia bacterium]
MDQMPDAMTSLNGQTVGNYQVVSMIGSGAMGEVYLAEHPQIGRRVAVKVMVPQYSANAEVAARFMSEARAVNTINHPNIIQIFDFGQLPDGRLYYTMEYLEGTPLTYLIRDHAPMSLREAEELVRQISDALDAAHVVGIVHRDLKPDNIFIKETPGGRFVKVLDFGIAKLLDGDMGAQHRTSTGMIMGTPLYMSPEQAAGQTHLISPRSDIYSLGVIAYQLLSARLPIEAPTTAQVLAKHITDPPVPLGSVAHGLPPTVCAVVESALAKDPADRPQSAGQFFMAFRQALTGADMDSLPTAVDSPSVRPPGASASGEFQGSVATEPTTLGSMATESFGGASGQRRRAGLWAGFGLAALLALGVGGYFALGLHGKGGPEKTPTSSDGMGSEEGPGSGQPGRADLGPGVGGEPRPAEPRPGDEAGSMDPVGPMGSTGSMDPVGPTGPMEAGLKIFALRVRAKQEKVRVEVIVAGQPSFQKTVPFDLEVKEGERVSLRAFQEGVLD